MSRDLTGPVGEFLAAAQITLRGGITAVTPSGMPTVDLLVADRTLAHFVAVQVKTSRDTKRAWRLGKKDEFRASPNLVFVFVRLNDGGIPAFHIVPSSVVAAQIARSHAEWLATPGRKGRAHRDNSMRKFTDAEDAFLDKWGVLGL